MSLYDRIAPSERLADLGLVVRRIRRNTGLDVVPILVVEGPADESLLGDHCAHRNQVFAAGTRQLVEGMLIVARHSPPGGCECVYLTDCDGLGKPAALKSDPTLVVTEGCDVEADLVMLGVVERVVKDLFPRLEDPSSLVETAINVALPLSVVRRRAHKVGQSMKRGGRRIRLADFPPTVLQAWFATPPNEAAVLPEVCRILGWSAQQTRAVESASVMGPLTFARVGSGKDALDALALILQDRGLLAGVRLDTFHDHVRRGLRSSDFPKWEVGRRILKWQDDRALTLL